MTLDELFECLRKLSLPPLAVAIVEEIRSRVCCVSKEACDGELPRPRSRNETLKVADLGVSYVIHGGEKQTAKCWADLYDLKPKHVVHRVNILGWALSRACTTPLKKH